MIRECKVPACGLAAILLVISAGELSGADYFVSPTGSDAAPGSRDRPFATIAKATKVLQPGDRCFLRAGLYREVLRPEHSGAPGQPITFSSFQDEAVTLSGAEPIVGWKHEGNGIYSAPMSWTWPDGNQLFANGEMLSQACWPNAGGEHLFRPSRGLVSSGTTNTLTCDELSGPKDAWKGAQLWCAGGSAWICWTSEVTGYDPITRTLTFDKTRERWYTPRKGNRFVLRGIRRALDAPGEWLYDPTEKRLLLIPPKDADINTLQVEAKRRGNVIDLSGRSYIHIEGIRFTAGGIRTDKNSSHIILKKLKGRYVSHSYTKSLWSGHGVTVSGNNNLLLSCDIGYSASSVVTVSGRDNRIINCNIHHGGYAGLWWGTVRLGGRRTVFSHNTIRHAGRDLINTHNLTESLVQYNDVSDAGWLTSDLGMFYGHNTDFANTEFRYNLVHDNHAEHCSMGIYFDHLSHNVIVHHNVVWNVGSDPIRINNPSYCGLVFNNTCWKTGTIKTFDHAKRNDLFATRYSNNIFNDAIRLPDHVVLDNNQVLENPPFRDPGAGDYRTSEPSHLTLGAYAPDGVLWKAGCDLENPPEPLPVYKAPRIPWMNLVKNACFEFGTLEAWKRTGSAKSELVKGNGWGNDASHARKHMTGTSKFELKLGPGRNGVEQVVTRLTPSTRHQLSAWMRVSDQTETVVLGVKNAGTAEVSASLSGTEWTRKSIDFETGPEATEATIYLLKSSTGKGSAWCDNVTLPLTP